MSNERRAGLIRAGDLAAKAGVSKDTLRHYERRGLLASRRSPNGYREYELAAVDRVHLVRRALAVGFTLAELARLLHIRDGGGRPCREVRALAAAKLESMEVQLRDLGLLRDQLRRMLREWDAKLAITPKGKPARLLDSLAQPPPELAGTAAHGQFTSRRRRPSA